MCMKKFAKLYETASFGQILVFYDFTTDETKIMFEGITVVRNGEVAGLASITLRSDECVSAEQIFENINETHASLLIVLMINVIEARLQEKENE